LDPLHELGMFLSGTDKALFLYETPGTNDPLVNPSLSRAIQHPREWGGCLRQGKLDSGRTGVSICNQLLRTADTDVLAKRLRFLLAVPTENSVKSNPELMLRSSISLAAVYSKLWYINEYGELPQEGYVGQAPNLLMAKDVP
jgi:hypothetical protein